MSKDWVKDMSDMHQKYGVNDWVEKTVRDTDQNVTAYNEFKDKMEKFLKFRIEFLKEEMNETEEALNNKDPEEIVDGLIDLCVIAIGTMNAFNVDPYKAWDRVFEANMTKEVGIKPGRPNPLGLPDLIKPKGWKGPNHNDNIGVLPYAL